MIDLRSLRSLIAVGTNGTVSAAADLLGYTPSAVSQQIKRLEHTLGTTLVERVGRGVVLTRQGQVLVSEGQRIFADVEAVEARTRAHDDRLVGTVRLATFATGLRGLVAALLADLRRDCPDLTVTVLEKDPAEAVDLVAQGRADVGVVHDWVGVPLHLPDSVQSHPLGVDRVDVLLNAANPLAARDALTPADLLDELWVTTNVGTICQAWFVHMYAGHPRRPRVPYQITEFSSQLRLVEEGVAVALVPRLGRGPLPGTVVAVPVVDPVPTRNVNAVHRDTGRTSSAVRHVIDRLRALYPSTSEG